MTRYAHLQCNAQTRRGIPCKCRRLPGRSRCRLHGGMSTGAKTEAGKKKVTKNLVAARAAIAQKPPEWFVERATKAAATRMNRLRARQQRQKLKALWSRWEEEDGSHVYASCRKE